jgi:hypothetical protein
MAGIRDLYLCDQSSSGPFGCKIPESYDFPLVGGENRGRQQPQGIRADRDPSAKRRLEPGLALSCPARCQDNSPLQGTGTTAPVQLDSFEIS